MPQDAGVAVFREISADRAQLRELKWRGAAGTTRWQKGSFLIFFP
jgi:hypothetical protein